MSTYCEYCASHPEDQLNCSYHDTQYGFPIRDDNALFERLVLEINQAGLSWVTILKKAGNFHQAYEGFDIQRVARYSQADTDRLLADAGIIRNRLKIKAAIHNAQVIENLQTSHGSFKNWLDAHPRLDLTGWTRLFKQTFTFTGGEIVNEFLMSSGYLPGAHIESCPVYHEIKVLNPAWMQARS